MPDPGVDLIRRIQHGDEAALADLMAEHIGLLRVHLIRYVGLADADDMLQEVWLRVWERAHQWDGRGRPLAWVLAIATNVALNHLRARRPVLPLSELSGEDDDEVEAPASASDALLPGPEEQALWREKLSRVRAALDSLSPDKQVAVRLVRIEGHTIREAAVMLGVPVGTLKSRLHHAHRQLMEHFEEENDEPL
jgi:RNA polymerase sigma-70 factor (ECF subfamily)